MAAVTPTEVSIENVAGQLLSGDEKRRAKVFIRYTSTSVVDTLNVATYVPGAADIEGIVYDTIDNAIAATAPTWSTTTLTFAGHTGSGVGELGLMVTFT